VSYTAAAIAGVLGVLTLDLVVLRTRLVTQRAFWLTYPIMVGFQLLANGILTGRRVVRYDRAAILGPRIAYAPVEDLAFGFALVVMALSVWVWLGRRDERALRTGGPSSPRRVVAVRRSPRRRG
jgi:lycopene cyclase domain-containing protein